MEDTPPSVAHKISSLPDQPGVYIWKDNRGRALYVGKAKNLRQRVRNYFTADLPYDPKFRRLVSLIADLDTIVVPSESQALILENNLVKEYRPRFNIKLRDDKSYPRIAVTQGERFPRVLVVRRINLPGARYFGPYTDVTVLRRTLKVVRRIFTVRSCHYDLPADRPDRPCLDYHINRCRAPCVGYEGETEYRRMIDDVIAFLEGKTLQVRARLREQMKEASERLDFERARELRESIRWLEQLEKPQSVEIVGGGNVDAIGYARDGDDAVGVILRIRTGKMVARQERFLENLSEEPNEAVMSAFLVRHYLPSEARATRVVLPFVPADHDQLPELQPGTKWLVPQRGINRRLVELADQNARHLMESFKIEALETDERVEDPVYALGRDLELTTVPRSLVCIDVSTNQGRDTVGSLVWFEAGRPKRSEYRRFKIKGTEGQQDDFAAINEVVTRFLRRRLSETKPLPDLIVIDGGKGQLSAAVSALREVGAADIPIASLAKREEEVFVPGRRESIRLPGRSPSLKLLQRARDESHRFALTYSRKRRTKRVVTSQLMNVPGIGHVKRRALLAKFGSLAGVRLASAAEIAALPGFSKKLAERLLEQIEL